MTVWQGETMAGHESALAGYDPAMPNRMDDPRRIRTEMIIGHGELAVWVRPAVGSRVGEFPRSV